MNPGYRGVRKVVRGQGKPWKRSAPSPCKRTQYSEATPLTPVVIEKAECVAGPPPPRRRNRERAMKVKLTTSMGPIVMDLDEAKAPISTANFRKYVESGHYNGTIFHRVINGFMIQGGGFTSDMQQKPVQPPIKNESTNGLKNDVYTVAMARTNVRDSATSQFFINVKDNGFLNFAGDSNPGYAVFGKVVEGKDTVDKIKAVATGNQRGMGDVPRRRS
jgi:cyclophilin family peptidyl-prolyl cis-trans isomerase